MSRRMRIEHEALSVIQFRDTGNGFAIESFNPTAHEAFKDLLRAFGIREARPMLRARGATKRPRIVTGACSVCACTSSLCIDHIIPKSRGGTDNPDNLQILCRSCNSSKGTKTMEEWLGQMDGSEVVAS